MNTLRLDKTTKLQRVNTHCSFCNLIIKSIITPLSSTNNLLPNKLKTNNYPKTT